MSDLRSKAPQYPPGWCPRHRRPRGPDGTCPLCTSTEGPSRREHLVIFAIASVALIAGAALVGYMWHHRPGPEDPASPEAARARPAPRPPRLILDAAVDVVIADDDDDDDGPTRAAPGQRGRSHRRPAPGLRRASAPPPTSPRVVVRPVSITMYVTPWCPHCTRARKWLRRQKIPFREVNVTRDRSGAAALRRLNPRGGVPTFNIDGRVLVGFSPAALMTAIEIARERRAYGP